ncbi:MAG TPA: magnesium transporter CorA family protein [Candidatus Saccharimonadia bacterium]|nr:magnesium transporter CorA family protein [Candidatus Saccharimonadia bacterium]
MQSSHFRTQKHHGITWIDINDPTREQISQAMDGRALHPLHLDASLLNGHLPHVEKEDNYVFLLLQLPDYKPATGTVETQQVAIFLAKDILITIHRGVIPSLQHIFEACEQDEQLRDDYFKKSSGYLLSIIIDGLLNQASELIQAILSRLDEIEDAVFGDHVAATYQIGQLRQRVTKLKRLMDFLKTILTDLAPRIDEYTGDKIAHYYRHNARTAQRLSLLLEEAKETVEIFKDADYTASNQKTNTTLAILTIIFTFTIPVTVMASLYGMNIPLPGGNETGPWTFWGQYTTLIIVAVLSVVPVLAMWRYFKKKSWF